MLKGIRVLDFTRLLPGPFATQILADLGAEVIKVEQPNVGDYARLSNKYKCIDGNSITFHGINRGKKSIALDLKNKNNINKLYKLLHNIDVVIESFRPGVMKKLGLDPEYLLKKYPKLIICSISGYGQTGPDKYRAGHDINYISRAGLMGLMANPTLPPAQIADISGGAFPALTQILASLYFREKTGKGNIIDVSMSDCSYSFGVYPQSISNNFKNAKISDGNWLLTTNQCGCYGVYKCKDGYISVGAIEPKFWNSFCKHVLKANHLVNKGLIGDEKGKQIRNEVERILMTKTCNEWNGILKNVDCCVEIIPKSEHISKNDKQLKERNLDIKFKINDKQYCVPKSPLNCKYTEFHQNRGPKLGEHNKEILSRL